MYRESRNSGLRRYCDLVSSRQTRERAGSLRDLLQLYEPGAAAAVPVRAKHDFPGADQALGRVHAAASARLSALARLPALCCADRPARAGVEVGSLDRREEARSHLRRQRTPLSPSHDFSTASTNKACPIPTCVQSRAGQRESGQEVSQPSRVRSAAKGETACAFVAAGFSSPFDALGSLDPSRRKSTISRKIQTYRTTGFCVTSSGFNGLSIGSSWAGSRSTAFR